MTALAIFVPSCGGHEDAIATFDARADGTHPIVVNDSTEGDSAGYLTKCQHFFEQSSPYQFIAYFHSDFLVHENGWDTRVLAEFTEPDVGVVGFGGALRLGHEDIYKLPYHFTQLARADFRSNLLDAEVHGTRESESRDVAVLDSFAVVVRRELLLRSHGWPVATYPNTSHCSDLWLSLTARRLGYRTRLVGVACEHRSGGKGDAGTRWLDARGGDVAMHRKAHEVTYQMFRDVLPVVIR